ncbi:MAG: hypothetical protein PHQ23_17575 [Candidatus Wallbacteria bacterium]|nr:hypothetical protein [Candidatus Wallbacteria bacterium]
MSENGPLASYKDGKVDISVWKKQIKEKDCFSLKLRKSFKDKNDQWQEQSLNIFDRDIGTTICLLSEGYRFILEQKNA